MFKLNDLLRNKILAFEISERLWLPNFENHLFLIISTHPIVLDILILG